MEDKMVRACSMDEEEEEHIYVTGGKDRKKPLEISRPTWVSNIKMDLEEIKLDGMDWIHLAQDRYK
jgi:hypothetical protein